MTQGADGRTPMLEVRDLHVAVEGKEILKGVNLTVYPGEVHAIMGPNGSGKSTLTKVLAGYPAYEVTRGEVRYQGRDLLEMAPDLRAREGIFMAFQYPVELPGVRNSNFIRSAVDTLRVHQGLEEMPVREFNKRFEEKRRIVDMPEELMKRSVNEGFSGGEKKRNEMLQMLMLEPRLALLDETDSGLDIDALKVVAGAVNQYRAPDNAIVIVTHYQRILDYVTPDYVHVLIDGRVVRSGGPELAHELEARGYEGFKEAVEGGRT